MMEVRGFMSSLVAGGMAGMCVDLTLFPLDTVKTRLQSQQGFYKAGGFRGIYAGIPSAAIGSFPNAALFFVTYECTKSVLGPLLSTKEAPLIHMFAASLGEMVACIIRVPTEVVKQRSQACPTLGTQQVLIETIKQEGILGLYRGFESTVKREIPFAVVQFPLWEFLKALWSWKQNHAVDSWQSAVCGAFAERYYDSQWKGATSPEPYLEDSRDFWLIFRYWPQSYIHQSWRFYFFRNI
ncbi:mitochondrial S-adenosylmethionine carrier protein isoform X3 [Mobula birostris]|uniref:mitochondrial S-adenosylmethionine carrier protein isoform X3 n=1 Tax=Mobula birostris TaxID=1983395 RepID=UPI003B285D68